MAGGWMVAGSLMGGSLIGWLIVCWLLLVNPEKVGGTYGANYGRYADYANASVAQLPARVHAGFRVFAVIEKRGRRPC